VTLLTQLISKPIGVKTDTAIHRVMQKVKTTLSKLIGLHNIKFIAIWTGYVVILK